MTFLQLVLTIFSLTCFVKIVSSSNNTTQFDNFTILWESFDLFTCAVQTKISVSSFSCVSSNYTQVNDISCLQQNTFDFQPSTCQSSMPVTASSNNGAGVLQPISITIDSTRNTDTGITTQIPTSAGLTASLTSANTAQTSSLTTSTGLISSATSVNTTQTSPLEVSIGLISSATSMNMVQTSSVTGTSTMQTSSLMSTSSATTQNPSTLAVSTTSVALSTMTRTITKQTLFSAVPTVSFTVTGTSRETIATTAPPRSPYYCPGNSIGSYCNITSNVCALTQPCLNAATCYPNNTFPLGYNCHCQAGYAGANCQEDERACKESTCWNNGTCIEVNSTVSSDNQTSFFCDCEEDYTGVHCELKYDFCANITCANKGQCRTIDNSWKCICLDPLFYYGNFCQFQTSTLLVHKALSRSFSSVAIVAITLTCSLVILMDVLKYFFRIDPVEVERAEYHQQREQEKNAAKSTVRQVAIRFQYIA